MSTKLYVGNLDYSVTNELLAELFAEAGSVIDATVVSHKDTGRSKGFGFVEMDRPESAKKAMEALNGREFQGRTIVVNEARPKEPRNF